MDTTTGNNEAASEKKKLVTFVSKHETHSKKFKFVTLETIFKINQNSMVFYDTPIDWYDAAFKKMFKQVKKYTKSPADKVVLQYHR